MFSSATSSAAASKQQQPTTPGQLRYNLRSMGAPSLVQQQPQPPSLPLSKPSTPAAAVPVPSPRHLMAANHEKVSSGKEYWKKNN